MTLVPKDPKLERLTQYLEIWTVDNNIGVQIMNIGHQIRVKVPKDELSP